MPSAHPCADAPLGQTYGYNAMSYSATTGQALKRPQKFSETWATYAELGILAVLIILFSAINPSTFPTVVNFNTILNNAAIPIIVGVGATFVVLMGRIDLSVEGIMGAASLLFVIMSANSRGTTDYGILAYPTAILLGAALGVATGLIHTLLKVPSFIVSLGIWYVGLGIANELFGLEMIPFLSNEAAVAWPVQTPLGAPNSFIVALVVVGLAWLVQTYTKLGRYPFAIGNNEHVARVNGIPVARYCIYIFALAGACSALAGILGSLALGAGAANIGAGTLFLTLAAVVIGGTPLSGGKGGVLRTLVGVLILSTLYNGLILSGVDPSIQSGVSGLVLICAIIVAGWSQREKLRVVK
jgi:ribose transport system permease protein